MNSVQSGSILQFPSCAAKAVADGFTWTSTSTVDVLEIPYSYCIENCPGVTLRPWSNVYFILFGFVFPALIFSTTVPRRWFLDVPPTLLAFGKSRWMLVVQVPVCLVAVVLFKTLDLLFLITTIFIFAGPILSSCIQEILIDGRVLSALKASRNSLTRGSRITRDMRMELITVLLCGAVENHDKKLHEQILDRLRLHRSQDAAKDLRLILTSQPDYIPIVGIPTFFFLGGYLYNSLDSSEQVVIGACYAETGDWWLVPVLVAIACSMTFLGLNPSTISVLVTQTYDGDRLSWSPLQDHYTSEAYPVWPWDQGRKKYEKITDTKAWEEVTGFERRVRLGWGSWTLILLLSLIGAATPVVLASVEEYVFGNPKQTCASLTFYLYMICQLWLLIVSAVRTIKDKPYTVLSKPRRPDSVQGSEYYWHLLVQGVNTLGRVFLISTTLFILGLTFLVVCVGNVAIIFGFYNNCLCVTPLKQWVWPWTDRTAVINLRAVEVAWWNSRGGAEGYLLWGTAIAVALICYAGWFYQRKMRNALLAEILDLEGPTELQPTALLGSISPRNSL